MSCQNYTDALNAVNAALLKSLIFAGSSIKGRLFQVIIVHIRVHVRVRVYVRVHVHVHNIHIREHAP